MGICMSKSNPPAGKGAPAKGKDADRQRAQRRLSVADATRQVYMPPKGRDVLDTNCAGVEWRFAAVSVPGTYLQKSMNPFTNNTKFKTNQDTYVLVNHIRGDVDRQILGVLDGHGRVGHDVSKFVSKGIVEYLCEREESLRKDKQKCMRKCFLGVDQALKDCPIESMSSGTTVNIIYIEGRDLYCGNCGDSRATLGYLDKNGKLAIKDMSRDHKPDLPEEKKRIEAANGEVAPLACWPDGPHRVWIKDGNVPGLAMSRSLGDGVAHAVGVSSEPEFITHTIDVETDKYLIIASDGVWEFISSEEAVKMVSKYKDPEKAADALVKESLKRWADEEPTCDDITALVCFLGPLQ